jgi:hypothetical protein
MKVGTGKSAWGIRARFHVPKVLAEIGPLAKTGLNERGRLEAAKAIQIAGVASILL